MRWVIENGITFCHGRSIVKRLNFIVNIFTWTVHMNFVFSNTLGSTTRSFSLCWLGVGIGIMTACSSVTEPTVEDCYTGSITPYSDEQGGLSGIASIRLDDSVILWTMQNTNDQSFSQSSVIRMLRFSNNEGQGLIEPVAEFTTQVDNNLIGSKLVEPLIVDENNVYFTVTSEQFGSELWSWKNDGSDIPRQLFDLYPGRIGSNIEWMIKIDNRFFLSARSDEISGVELHSWNGDPDVLPVLVKKLGNGAFGSGPESPLSVGNDLWFTAFTEKGTEWWSYPIDGSRDPEIIFELDPSEESSLISIVGIPNEGILHRGLVYFAAKESAADEDNVQNEHLLWTVDPSDTENPVLIDGTTEDGFALRDPNQFISTPEGLYFRAANDRLMLLKLDGELNTLAYIGNASELIKVGQTFYYNDKVASVLVPPSNSINGFMLGDYRARDAVSYPANSGYIGGGLYDLNGKLTIVEEEGVRLVERKAQCS